MSRGLTAAQIVAAGDYLTADFDPGSLTVNQLLGVFGYHNITFPGNYTKPKLVDLFNDAIKANATKLRRERVNKANSIASDEGITNGHTGELLRQKVRLSHRAGNRALRASFPGASGCKAHFASAVTRTHGCLGGGCPAATGAGASSFL
jgi:hypothetical protein